MEKGENTQYEQVKNHLLKFGKISFWDAISLYRITRLRQYIYIMRKEGYHFNVGHIKNKDRTGWYSLYILVDEVEDV